MPHLIHRLRFELLAPSAALAGGAMDAVEMAVGEAAFSVSLDSVMASASGGDEIVIDRAEIDLGTLSPKSLRDDLGPLLAEQLGPAIKALQERARRTSPGPLPGDWRPATQGSTVFTRDPVTPTRSPVDSGAALFHWLQTGTRPWWVSPKRWLEIQSDWAEPGTVSGFSLRLARLVSTRRSLVWRLLSLPELCRVLDASIRTTNLPAETRSGPFSPEACVQQILSWLRRSGVLDESDDEPTTAYLRAWVASPSDGGSEPPPAPAPAPNAGPAETPKWIAESRQVPRPDSAPTADAAIPAIGDGAPPPATTSRPEGVAAKRTRRKSGKSKSAPVGFPRRSQAPGEGHGLAGIPVEAAGLVLLHPFLPGFLAELGFHHRGSTRLSAPWHAAQALHWLAWGRVATEDSALVLEKWLSGLYPEDADLLPRLDDLGSTFTEEGTALLEAVIAHWSALGKTSPAGLRESFLQRSGLLFPQPTPPRLAVEHQSYDMLLNQLPWSVSPVGLPWMPPPLIVDWEGVT